MQCRTCTPRIEDKETMERVIAKCPNEFIVTDYKPFPNHRQMFQLRRPTLSKCSRCGFESCHEPTRECCECYNGILLPITGIRTGSLIEAVRLFKQYNAFRWTDYWRAVGACNGASIAFCRFAQAMGIRAKDGHFGNCINFWHVVSVIIDSGIIIDWTHRQYQKDCPIPVISTIKKFRFQGIRIY